MALRKDCSKGVLLSTCCERYSLVALLDRKLDRKLSHHVPIATLLEHGAGMLHLARLFSCCRSHVSVGPTTEWPRSYSKRTALEQRQFRVTSYRGFNIDASSSHGTGARAGGIHGGA